MVNVSVMTTRYYSCDMIQAFTRIQKVIAIAKATVKARLQEFRNRIVGREKGGTILVQLTPKKSPTLPLLPAHSHEPIEQLLPQPHRRNLERLPTPIHNLQPIRHRLARRPPHHDLRLPPQPAHLLQLPDIRNGDRELGRRLLGLQAGAVGGLGGEGDGRDVDVGGDVDPAFAALVASLEVDGAGELGVVSFGEDAEVVAGVLGADNGAGFVHAEFGLDARFRGAFEEAEDVLAVFVFLLLAFGVLGLLFGGFLVRVFVYGLVDFFVGCVEG